MKIGFLSSIDPFNIKNWSGTLYHITQVLGETHQIEWIGQDVINAFYINKILGYVSYPEKYAPLFGKVLSQKINASNYDILIVRDYYLGSFLNVKVPIVYLGDTTFHLYKDYLNNPSKAFEKIADQIEEKMIARADCVIYSSEWARNDAIFHYHARNSKIHVVEFGANIPHPMDYQADIQMDTCNLVFIGRNWQKKGGDKMLGAYRILKKEAFPCTCTLIGSVPPNASKNDDPDLTIIPFLDKTFPAQLDRFTQILNNAHFLILPTEFDAFGIVFCEASAYGVPSIAANVGGVSQPIKEGCNGFLLSRAATAEDYARMIKNIFSDKERYIALRKSSRHEYEKRLNWVVWGNKINTIFEDTINRFNRKLVDNNTNKKEQNECNFYIPVYVINLKRRTERRRHIEAQFLNKREFALTWIDAVEHPIGAVGLWKSMVMAVRTAIKNDDDIMIICEDDHTFTPAYNCQYLLDNIIGAYEQGADLLSGGIGGFGTAIPVAPNRYRIDWFWSTQFIVIFKHLFQKIIDYNFKDTDTADGVLSALSKDKMTIYPFISIQKDFGYSDVTRSNNEISGIIDCLFKKADFRLNLIHRVLQET